MTDTRPDHLAEKIRRRRLGETAAEARSTLLPTLRDVQRELAELKVAIESAADKPLEVARLLGEAKAKGRMPTEIANALGVGRPWVAKRLGLLTAPAHVRVLIEFGKLAETDYYNHRAKVLDALDGETKTKESKSRRRRGARYVRQPKVSLNEPAARATVHLLAHMATILGLTPIDVDGATLRGLSSTLELRAPELWDALKDKL